MMRSLCCGRRPRPPLWTVVPNKALSLEPTQAQYSVISVLVRQETVTWGGWTWAATRMDSGRVCFITAGPITKLFAWGGRRVEDMYVL